MSENTLVVSGRVLAAYGARENASGEHSARQDESGSQEAPRFREDDSENEIGCIAVQIFIQEIHNGDVAAAVAQVENSPKGKLVKLMPGSKDELVVAVLEGLRTRMEAMPGLAEQLVGMDSAEKVTFLNKHLFKWKPEMRIRLLIDEALRWFVDVVKSNGGPDESKPEESSESASSGEGASAQKSTSSGKKKEPKFPKIPKEYLTEMLADLYPGFSLGKKPVVNYEDRLAVRDDIIKKRKEDKFRERFNGAAAKLRKKCSGNGQRETRLRVFLSQGKSVDHDNWIYEIFCAYFEEWARTIKGQQDAAIALAKASSSSEPPPKKKRWWFF